jgi:hypothetical protein
MKKVKFPTPGTEIVVPRGARHVAGVKVCTKTAVGNSLEKGSPNNRTLRDELKGTTPVTWNGKVCRPIGKWIDAPNCGGEYITANTSVFK